MDHRDLDDSAQTVNLELRGDAAGRGAPASSSSGGPWWTDRVAVAGLGTALLALLCSLFAAGLAIFLVLVAIVLAVIAGVRSRRRGTSKALPAAAAIAALLALIVATASSPQGQQGFEDGYRSAASAPTPTAAPDSASSQAAAPSAVPASAGSTRGLLSEVAWWDRNHKAAATATCTSEGEQAIGTLHAWQLPDGGTACYDQLSPGPTPPWGNNIVGIDLYFPKHVTEQTALAAVASLLPADAALGESFPGVNNDVSTKPGGTCRETVFTSGSLASAVQHANPSWTDDPAKAGATLYSGHAASDYGSDSVYRPSSINEVILTIGGENRGADGIVHC